MKHRESLYLLAPAVLLLGVGFALKNRAPATVLVNEPFRLRAQKVRFEPVTPREFFEGYDTKAIVVLGHSGAKPNWWDIGLNSYSSQNSGAVFVVSPDGKSAATHQKTLVSEPFLDRESGEWRTKILLETAKIPPSRGEVRFRDWVGFDKGNARPKIPALSINFRIRKAGEKAQIPKINRVSPLKVEKIFLAPDFNNPSATRVKIWVSSPKKLGLGSLDLYRLRAFDGGGKETFFDGGIQRDYEAFPLDHAIYFGDSGKDRRADFGRLVGTFSGTIDSQSPISRLEGDFFCGDKWPLRASINLRDAKGKRISTPTSPQLLTLESARLRPATKDERSIYKAPWVAAFKVRVSPRVSRPKNWAYSLDFGKGAHLENREGSTWWQSNLITPQTPRHHYTEIPSQLWTEAEGLKPTRYSIAYFFDTKALSLSEKPLFFQDTLRLDDGPPLPIKLQIRK